jgi:pimeloyl-ACP methyl ester carboxylesterase
MPCVPVRGYSKDNLNIGPTFGVLLPLKSGFLLHFTTHIQDSDRPWVTFIHGAGGSSSIWYKQVKAFRDRFNVLLIDLRGHGRSKVRAAQAKGRYTFEEITQDVLEVLEHLRIESAHFVGISLGTIVVRELAELRPERVRSMILAGAVMKLNIRGKILMRCGYWFKSVIPYLLLYKFFAFIIMPRASHRESRSLFIREARKLAQKEFIRWFRLAADVNARLHWFRQRETGIPTLYIMGDQDHMFLPSVRLLAREHAASSTLVVIPDCGHVVNVEQPSAFNRVTVDFIEALARR